MTAVTIEQVYDALYDVIDPEIGLDIVTLGLVYDVKVDRTTVDVTFTLTTRGCPMERAIRGGILRAVGQLDGVTDVRAHVVWEPRWDPGRIQEGAL
jgi:metal-sulfur cluster biosynthetic enzyme